MVKKITNNLGYKVLSLVLASMLWLFVVNIEDPQISTTLRGIPVERLNENAITSKKQAIQNVAGETVDVKIKGKRSIIYKLTNQNIRAYVDMKNISITGAIDIELDLPNEVELVSKNPSSVVVKLEDIISKNLELQYVKVGKAKNGYVDLSPSINPSSILVEGAESIIYKIEKAVIAVDINGISGEYVTSAVPEIYDYSGALVEDIRVSHKQVQVKIPVEKTKPIPIIFTPQGELAEGYAYLGHKLSEEMVSVRGQANLIDKITEVKIENVSIAEMTESQTVSVNLAKLLPDGISLNQDSSIVEVDLQIEPILRQEFEFVPSDIEPEGLRPEREIKILSELPFTVLYEGVESKIKELSRQQIKPKVFVEDLENGFHTLVIQWPDFPDLKRISGETFVTAEIVNQESQ